MAEDVAVLRLLLTANYVGRSAFAEMSSDLAGLTAQTNGLTRLGSAFSAVGNIMVAAGAAAAIGVGLAVKAAVDYDQAIQRIVAVMPNHLSAQADATVAVDAHTAALMRQVTQVQALKNEIASAAVSTGQDPTQMATGAYYLFSSLGALGLSNDKGVNQFLGQNIIGQLAQYARASGPTNAGGVSFSQAAQDLPRLFTAYGMPINQWGQGMGQFTYLENQAHLTQSQLVQSMSKFTPAATAANIPFGEAALLMAAEASSGVAGSRAGTESSTGLITMLGSPKAQAQLAQMGLSNKNFFDSSGKNPLPLYQSLALLESKLAPMSAADRLGAEHNIFGLVGLRAYGGLLNTGMDKYSNLIQGANQAGVMKSPAQAEAYMAMISAGQMQGPQAQFQSLASAAKLFGIAVGEAAMPAVMKLVQHLRDFLVLATGFINDLQTGTAHLHGFAGAIEHIVLALSHLKLGGGAIGLGGLLTGGPLALIGGGLGMKGIGAVLKDMGQGQKGLLGRMFGTLGAEGSNFIGPLAAGATRGTGLLGGLQSFLGASRGAGTNLAAHLPGAIGAHLDAAAGRAPAGWGGANKFTGVFQSVNEGIGKVAGGAKNLAGGALSGLVGGFQKFADVLLHPLASLKSLGGLIAGILPAIAGLGTAILPIIGIFLLIAGAIVVVVLAVTHFRPQLAAIGAMIASVFGPMIKGVIGFAIQTFHQLQATWQANSKSIMAAMKGLMDALLNAKPVFQVIAGAIGLALKIVIGVVGAVLGAFIHALPGIIGFFTGIVHIVTTVSQIIIAIFHGQWGQIPGLIGKLFGQIISTITGAVGTILGFIGNLIGNILGFFGNLFDKLVGHSIIPDMIRLIIFWFLQLPLKILGMIGGLVLSILGFFGNLFVQAVKGVASGVGNVVKGFGDLVTKIPAALASLPGTLLKLGGDLMQAIANGITGGLGSIASALGGLKDKIGSGIKNAVNGIPGIGGIASHFGFASGGIVGYASGGITGYASGGTLPGMNLVKVGEKGWEYAVLPTGTHVFNHDESFSMLRNATLDVSNPLNSNRPLSLSSLHVDQLHLPDDAFDALAAKLGGERKTAPEYSLMRDIQARREAATGGYSRRSPFDDDYRYAGQWTR